MSTPVKNPDGESPRSRNYWLLLSGGGLYLMGLQIGDFRSVLPWIAGSLGVAPILIALIVPVTQAGQVLGQLFIGPQMAMLRRAKGALALTGLGSALAIAFAAGFAALVTPEAGGLIILVSAGVFGCFWGLFTVSNENVIARVLTPRLRSDMMAIRSAAAGLLTMAATLGLYLFFPGLLNNKMFLLWIAVALWVTAAVFYCGIAETPMPPRSRNSPLRELRRGAGLIRSEPWFGEFLIGRLWLLPIELAIPFYTIHLAQLSEPTAKDLIMLVFAISAGLLLGGPLWGYLVPRNSPLAMALGAWFLVFAGALTLLVDEVLKVSIPYFHVASFALLSAGRQGVIQSRTYYLADRTPPDDRPIYISIAESLMGVCGVGIALALGFAAQFTSIFNPLLCLIALNMTAAVFALQVFGRGAGAGARAA